MVQTEALEWTVREKHKAEGAANGGGAVEP